MVPSLLMSTAVIGSECAAIVFKQVPVHCVNEDVEHELTMSKHERTGADVPQLKRLVKAARDHQRALWVVGETKHIGGVSMKDARQIALHPRSLSASLSFQCRSGLKQTLWRWKILTVLSSEALAKDSESGLQTTSLIPP